MIWLVADMHRACSACACAVLQVPLLALSGRRLRLSAARIVCISDWVLAASGESADQLATYVWHVE